MTSFILDFLREVKAAIGQPKRILEVGSLNINGSAREVFQTNPQVFYEGIDLIPGQDVDRVVNIRDFVITEKYDLVICCEVLEHDPYFWLSVVKMQEALKEGGWLIITTPGFYFPEHQYPDDYYRFMPATYREIFFKDMKEVKIVGFQSFGGSAEKPDWIGGYGKK